LLQLKLTLNPGYCSPYEASSRRALLPLPLQLQLQLQLTLNLAPATATSAVVPNCELPQPKNDAVVAQ
jgi:hypothetical protein